MGTIAATDTMRAASSTFTELGSIHRCGRSRWRGRFKNALTRSSISSHLDVVLGEPHGLCDQPHAAVTERVLVPCARAAKAFSATPIEAVFAVGFGVGWRFRVGGLFPFLGLLVMFGVLDYVVEEITLWPMTYWVMLDLIVIQVGYLVGAGSGQLMGERRSRNLRQPI